MLNLNKTCRHARMGKCTNHTEDHSHTRSTYICVVINVIRHTATKKNGSTGLRCVCRERFFKTQRFPRFVFIIQCDKRTGAGSACTVLIKIGFYQISVRLVILSKHQYHTAMFSSTTQLARNELSCLKTRSRRSAEVIIYPLSRKSNYNTSLIRINGLFSEDYHRDRVSVYTF